MKTAVTQTSIDAYQALTVDGLSAKQRAIVSQMQPGSRYSRRQLAMMSGMETSSASGRVNELLALSAVEINGTLYCPFTGRTVEAVRLACKQLELLL